jgi:hypothetical protein
VLLYAAFFDEEGHLDPPKFESWVAGLMARVIGNSNRQHRCIKRLTLNRHTNTLDGNIALERYIIR